MDSRLFAFAEKFAEAGLTAITFDYRNFGFSGGRLRQYINVPNQMEDWHHVLGYARGLPNIDPDRIVLWSTSFGGGWQRMSRMMTGISALSSHNVR